MFKINDRVNPIDMFSYKRSFFKINFIPQNEIFAWRLKEKDAILYSDTVNGD